MGGRRVTTTMGESRGSSSNLDMEGAMKRRFDSRRLFYLGILLVAAVVICVQPAAAQIDRGAIAGKVLDSSGAIVPKATITVTNKATAVSLTTPVNDAGDYQVLALIPGIYTVKVSADGFQTAVQDDIEVHVQDRLSLNFVLKVGSVNQQVLVSGAEPLLQTQTADGVGVVNEEQGNDLPLNGRRYADLALLDPPAQKSHPPPNPSPPPFHRHQLLHLH